MIVLEKFSSIGPWGLSYGDQQPLHRQIYASDSVNRPWTPHTSSLEEQLLSGKLDGQIPKDVLSNSDEQNSRLQNGPLETRYAHHLLSLRLCRLGGSDELDNHNLICAVEPQGSLVGYRNGLRLGYDFECGFNESNFISNLGNIFDDTHPMVSLLNMPNQMISNLAISFKIGGETVNCAGRNSSFEALELAMNLVKSNKQQRILLLGAFCYRVSIILNCRVLFDLSNLKSRRKDTVSLSEWVGLTTVSFAKQPKKGSLAVRALSSSRLHPEESIYDNLMKSLNDLLSRERVSFEEIEIIIANDISTGLLVNSVNKLRAYNSSLKIVDLYQSVGNSFHCSFLQSLELAQMIFEVGKVPGRLRKDYRSSMYFDGVQVDESDFKGRFILVVEFRYPDLIQLGLVQGYVPK